LPVIVIDSKIALLWYRGLNGRLERVTVERTIVTAVVVAGARK
jgi:hypothetical protein